MRQMYWHATVLSLVTLGTAACSSHAVKPAIGMDTAAAAEAGAPVPSVSNFNVPLAYDFTDVLKEVERAVPKTFGSLDSVQDVPGGAGQRFAYEATRGDFTAFARGSRVYLRATFSYTVRGYFKSPVGGTVGAGCGTHADRPQIVVELVAPLTLMPSWHLQSHAQVNRVERAPEDRGCRISFVKYNVTDRVVDAARKAVTGRLDYIDERVAAVDLTTKATGWWAQLNQPIHLGDSTWLLLQPSRFRLKGMQGTGHILTVQAGLEAFPMIVTGAEPRRAVPPLPPLGKDTAVSGFRIAINGNMDYGAVSRTLSKSVHGQALTQSGHHVTIESIDASPAGRGKLALTLNFTGEANGSIRLVGTPRHNAALRQIVMPDLDYDLKTSNQILKVYAWLHSDVILAALRANTQFPADPVLEHGKDLLSKGLNRKIGNVMTLSATVDSVSVTGIYVTPDALIIRAIGWGNARAVVVPRSSVVKVVRAGGN